MKLEVNLPSKKIGILVVGVGILLGVPALGVIGVGIIAKLISVISGAPVDAGTVQGFCCAIAITGGLFGTAAAGTYVMEKISHE